MTKKPEIKFKHLIIIPMCVALVGLLTAAILFIYRLQRMHIDQKVRAHLESVQEISQSHLTGISLTLSGIMEFIKENKPLQNAWLMQDRNALLQHANRIFKHILTNLHITHFYFINPNRVCFLRIHKPEYYGDTIRRCTLERSGRNMTPASGMELGPLGTLTLRVVHPWWINGKMTGYIELGVEIENMAPKLKRILGSDLIFTVSKNYLDRNSWGEGLKMMGRSGDWNKFSDFVVISQTLPEIPREIYQFMQQRDGDREKHIFNVSNGLQQYNGGFVPLIDAGNNVIGDIIVLTDITEEAGLLRALSATMMATGAVGAALFIIFYVFVGRIERRLIKSHYALTNEINERKRAQKALQQAHDKMESRVKKRTAELLQVNARLHHQVFECEQAEQALRESEEKYSTLVEDSLTGVYIVQDGKIRFVNQKFAEIFGYSRNALVGMESLELIYPEDRPMVAELREKRLHGEKAPSVYEVRGMKKDGTIIWLLRSTTLVHYRKRPAIAGNVMEITKRKLTESKLRQSEEEHRMLSGKLLSAEENERKKIARDVHDSIGQALSAIKYGLENSIRQLRGQIAGADLKTFEAIVPLTQKSIEEVRRIAMDLRPSILDDLGILATINWFCREFETIYSGIAIHKEIAVREDAIPAPLKTVIYRILQEALNNAAKHSQADHVRISLKEIDRRIELLITDNGRGFDVEEALALKPTGLGFGLASMKKRAEHSGGMFWLDAETDRGTQIRISWPRADNPKDVIW